METESTAVEKPGSAVTAAVAVGNRSMQERGLTAWDEQCYADAEKVKAAIEAMQKPYKQPDWLYEWQQQLRQQQLDQAVAAGPNWWPWKR